MPEEKESQHEGTPQEVAEGVGGAQSVPSGAPAERAEGGESGTPDSPTPEREMERGTYPRSSEHDEGPPPGETSR